MHPSEVEYPLQPVQESESPLMISELPAGKMGASPHAGALGCCWNV